MICDLCGGSCFKEISQHDRMGQPLLTGLCEQCGLVCHMPVPSEQEIADYYALRYRQEYHGEETPSAKRVLRAWRNGERIYRQMESYLQPGMKVFEVGAGIGCTVKQFEINGFLARGIEPGCGFSRFARECLHANIENTNLFKLHGIPENDLVLLIHVIEHFISPSRALHHIHTILKPRGRLYVECPNLAAPFATFQRLFHFAHVYNFTPKTLIAMAEKCGFGLEKAFSNKTDPNIQMLFVCQRPGKPAFDQGQSGKTMAAIRRYNVLTYHLRREYLLARINKIASYVSEALFARLYVKRLLKRFQKAKTPGRE